MSVILSLMLASGQALPFIDRAALHTLAKYETAQGVSSAKKGVATARDTRMRGLCGRAARLGGPVDLLAEVRQSYAMSVPRRSILTSTCAVLSDSPFRTASR